MKNKENWNSGRTKQEKKLKKIGKLKLWGGMSAGFSIYILLTRVRTPCCRGPCQRRHPARAHILHQRAFFLFFFIFLLFLCGHWFSFPCFSLCFSCFPCFSYFSSISWAAEKIAGPLRHRNPFRNPWGRPGGLHPTAHFFYAEEFEEKLEKQGKQ